MTTHVAVSPEGADVAWCAVWHQDEVPCDWTPPPGTTLEARTEKEWDSDAATPCLHGLHQAECARCLDHGCVHLADPTRCIRCIAFDEVEKVACWECRSVHYVHERTDRNGTHSKCPKCGSEITAHSEYGDE